MFFDSKLGTLFTFSYKLYSLHALLESNKSWDLADKQTPYSSLTPDATLLGQREKESHKNAQDNFKCKSYIDSWTNAELANKLTLRLEIKTHCKNSNKPANAIKRK